MFGVFLFLTYYLQQNLRYSPLMTGVAFLPFAAGIAVSAGLSNTQLVPRLGPRPLIPVGMAVAAAGMFWLRHLTESSTYARDVLPPLVVLGLGVGLTFAPAIVTATAGVPQKDAGVGSAMVNTSQQIGGAVGAAVLSTIFTSALTRYVGSHPPGPRTQTVAAIHGYTVAFSVACGLFLVGAVITATLLRSGRLPTDSAGEPGAGHAPDDGEQAITNGDDDVDLDALRRRIAELETENRHLQEVLHIRTVAAPASRSRARVIASK
jgi:sugar phosphate permease